MIDYGGIIPGLTLGHLLAVFIVYGFILYLRVRKEHKDDI